MAILFSTMVNTDVIDVSLNIWTITDMLSV
jgi:hypothetical protein